MAVQTKQSDILADENRGKREQIIEMLTRAYWMEIETVINYVANSTNPDGVCAQEIGHARKFATRIKELYSVVPGSLGFHPEQHSLQPPDEQTDIVHVIKGVIDAERSAIRFYNELIEAADQIDWVTQDMVIEILRDEQGHLRLFEGFLREYQAEGKA
jgi:bacterioferritin